MRTYSINKLPAVRKAAVLALVSLIAACGGGTTNTSDSINTSRSGANLAATIQAVPVATPANYTVANLGASFDIFKEKGSVIYNRVLNNHGQVVGHVTLPGSDILQAVRYENGTLKILGTSGNADISSIGTAINDNGQVAGNWLDGDSYRAFLFDGNATIDLGTLNNANLGSYATAINADGWVAGSSFNGKATHAFLYNGIAMTDLGALGSETNESKAVAINAKGWVTGVSYNGKAEHAFLYSGMTMIDLGTLGDEGSVSYPAAINADGQVTGYSDTGKSDHAFLYNGTAMIDLGSLGGESKQSYGLAINAKGQVTGYSFNGTAYHAFLYDGTTMTDLGALENANNESRAVAINASGQVVGISFATARGDRAFIKSPGDSQMIDLNTRLINAPGMELYEAVAISDSGYILAQANTGWVLLKPVAAVPTAAAATLGAITANDPIAVGAPVNVSVQFSDINTTDTHTALWTWEGNGTSPGVVTEPNGTVAGTVTGSTTFSAAGLYNVAVSVTDSSGLRSDVSRQVVVYDPSAGFVTGGGWITSPVGAYKADERLSGRATFGFVSKYLKGANKPTGETEFRFQTSGLNFYSNNYDWLVVGGARAQYKGTGTINGRGGYQFMLTAVDGDLIAKGTADRFRIKIWHRDESTNADVTDYDNQLNSTVAGSNQEGTILGGGSINVKIR
jgi:probable HAF family extracellular repeat protein